MNKYKITPVIINTLNEDKLEVTIVYDEDYDLWRRTMKRKVAEK